VIRKQSRVTNLKWCLIAIALRVRSLHVCSLGELPVKSGFQQVRFLLRPAP
jgi:hypothetical protein